MSPLRLLPALALALLALGLLAGVQQADPVRPEDVASKPVLGPALAWLAQGPAGLWGALVGLLLLGRAAVSLAGREPWFPGYILLAGLALAIAGYRWSNLDWASLPVEADLAEGGNPGLDAVLLALVPLGAVILYNAWLQLARLEADHAHRGVPAKDAGAAQGLALWPLPLLGAAAGCTALVGLLFALTDQGRSLGVGQVLPSVALFPAVGAAMLLAVALLLGVRGRSRRRARAPPGDRQTS